MPNWINARTEERKLAFNEAGSVANHDSEPERRKEATD